MIELRGKNVLITGGSAGLGVNLVVKYSNSKDSAEALAAEIREAQGVKVHVVQADTHSLLGGLNIVIFNAGWTKFVPFAKIDELDDEIWDGCLNANIKSHFYLFRAAKKYLERNADGGTFIVSASLAGRRCVGSSIPYAVSKAALIHLVQILAKSRGPKVRTHAVSVFREAIRETIEQSPIKEIADVDETAVHFVFLCQLASSTGTTVGVDAGVYL
ncbi:NAD(P)-binding protein [Metschnikowia bicuspidata]|uniref:NAD(P)-binding protein n=1 Tax=Metschnikowia bicuspidata TaxID=27322 RepID=A0A4P9ZFG7_9ASCO|nr:NAD(P)-binding protein [Metschnikowia bicuspidata]